MGVRDPKEAMGNIFHIDNDVLRASRTISITNDNSSNVIHCGRKVVATSITVLIKVKRYCEALIRIHVDSQLKCLSVKLNGRMGLMKDSLKLIQYDTIKRVVGATSALSSQTMLKSIICVMNVELGIYEITALQRKNRASLMNELPTQDKGVRTSTTSIDRRSRCFANRSHGQRIVVKKDKLVKVRGKWTFMSEEVV
jgi:hypothetical protein